VEIHSFQNAGAKIVQPEMKRDNSQFWQFYGRERERERDEKKKS